MKEVTLETDRLLLRFPRESDFEEYAKICADAEVIAKNKTAMATINRFINSAPGLRYRSCVAAIVAKLA